ncbi:hypothetical protein Celaphus_00007417 [Cervus elaphus hippelaphus]|uniref:Uncharacterized protein n=1 Tax=Cervus elaphus hippelaphus TaxID=46360 RepID=A0A212CBP8_CEREH|nr:hypothetical protein Celaphus_00007417 [Cervus elaphus hippelaphus]
MAACGGHLLCYHVHPLNRCPAWGHGQSHVKSERLPEEAGSTGLWIFLVVSLTLQGPGTLRPVSTVESSETLQAPHSTPGKEIAFFRVEAVGEDTALEKEELAWIRQEFQLLVEDIIMKEVEVVVDVVEEQVALQEWEEKPEEESQEDASPEAQSNQPVL